MLKTKQPVSRRNTASPSKKGSQSGMHTPTIGTYKKVSTRSKTVRPRPSDMGKSLPNRTPQHNPTFVKKQVNIISSKKGTIRVIPIGGCEEVGRNMTIFEYENDIIILDMGLQFPEEDMPGIDYIIPNISYLKGKEKRVRGVVFSHGHLDHIGAAPVLLEQLGYPPIIGRDLTLALIKHKQEDYKKESTKNLKVIRVKNLKDKVRLGKFLLSFFQVEHSIMDAMGVAIETDAGTVIHPGDWTMERDETGKTHVRYDFLQQVKRPSMLMLESLGSLSKERHGTYEEMYNNLYGLLNKAPGRIIIGTFSSQVERVKWVIYAAAKLHKKVALDGYSMKLNVEIAKKLGYIKIPRGILIDIKDISKYPENKVVVLCTGAQGEENAVLMRVVNKTHRFITLRRNDTVIFSSSVIPGNERSIQRLKDNIYRQCDHVIHGDVMDVHISGHSTRQDILEMVEQIKPDYFVPVYGNHFFLKEAKNLVVEHGNFPEGNTIVPDNGTIIDMTKEGVKVLDKKATSNYVFIDGLGVSDMQHVVLRDRQVLAEDGMVVVIVTIDTKTGQLIQNPDIISRGFVFLKDNKKLIEDVRAKVRTLVVESDPLTWADANQIRNNIREKIGQFLFKQTEKRPMVLPVVIEV
ncbi:ribonuclease J [Patescibacteria group bacterium]|nr:ribonuclease J [Patescibacteria group bacterium]MBU1721181.1 ribonuclease J [Patescibacteria group bacterium]MBU1900889.1 ribonuclease J [Patescibacteria group bacterium]